MRIRTRLSPFLVLLLAACQGSAGQEDIKPVDAAHSAIRFEHVDYDPDLAEYAVQRDARTGNQLHVARFYGSDAFAMLAVFKTSASYVVKERSTEAYVGEIFEDAQLDWGQSGRAPSHLGPMPYRLFRIAGEPFSCVGFSQQAGESHDDRGRKKDALFGFFCQDESRPMSTDEAQELIGNISLGGRR